MDEVLKEFITESGENLDQMDRFLIELEKTPSSPDILAAIFRAIHTIKGASGFLGLTKLERLTHAGENLLSRLRDRKLELNKEMTNALLKLVDSVRTILNALQEDGSEGGGDYTALAAELNRLSGIQAAAPTPAPAPTSPNPAPAPVAPSAPTATPPPPAPDPVLPRAAIPVPAASTPTPPPPSPGTPVTVTASAPVPIPDRAADNKVRVDVGLLDKLMNLVGELVLSRNQIMQVSDSRKDAVTNAALQRLNLVTTELQEEIMKTRLQSIETVWAKFPRIVRDLGNELGKQIRLEMEGKNTELDRTIIEAIKDPLTHIVRNSVDHGIEKPEKRVAAGKNPEGRLFLRAYHEGGQVNIEISDDGAGIDTNRIKQKALERGLITSDQAARMAEREAFHLLFLPGFSTAEKITNVSGRGVGMDVVKTNIEKIGGSVDLHSECGHGTTLKIKIPLTLAIIPALIVTSGSERFAIPQVSLVELVRLEPEQARKQIESLYGVPVYRLRGDLLSLCYLDRELGLVQKTETHLFDDPVNIVVLQADGRQFGLVVDQINDTEEIVVKPLGKQLKSITAYAGATIMGDGKVALILDVLGLAQHAQVVSQTHEKAIKQDSHSHSSSNENNQQLLIFQVGESGRMAIPLSQVSRLEEIPRARVEFTGNREVVQYRGQVMPLIHLPQFFGQATGPGHSTGPMQVVVYSEGGRSVGLVVSSIQDIVRDEVSVQLESQQKGMTHCVVIQNKVTDLIDVRQVIRQADPTFS